MTETARVTAPLIEYRVLSARDQFEDAVTLQKRIWGFEDIELLPVRLFVVAANVGGRAWGAYDAGRMIGFCLAIPGLKPAGGHYWHSHMLGVLPEYRNLGVGRRLKLMQREDALARGIELVEWTFDPLEIKNAFFNIERLGAIVRRYVFNQYGTTSSHLHGSLPTDRCIAEWWITNERVRHVLAGDPPERCVEARVAVPAEIGRLRSEEPERAREIQKSVGEQLTAAFAAKLAVIGVERTPDQGVYLLGRCDED